jgi:hypothetical protein
MEAQPFFLAEEGKGLSQTRIVGPMVLLAREPKAFSPPVQRTAKVQEPQPDDSVKKCLEATSLGQKQLRGIEGADGFPDPEESLLLGIFQIPRRELQADAEPR